MASFNYAVKWLREGKAVVRQSLAHLGDKKAIWWDPGSGDFYHSHLWSDEEISHLYDEYNAEFLFDNGFQIVSWTVEDFIALDWEIYPDHCSESDAWIDGDLPGDVEVVTSRDP